MNDAYVHGHAPREHERLSDQARTLADLIHSGTCYPPGSRVLEAGCGVGAQTVELARRSPGARITAVDISAASIAAARDTLAEAGLVADVDFLQADLFRLPFAPATFDHAFLCFVLEHLARPAEALAIARRLLKPGGTLTVVEGDHGSVLVHPEDPAARAAIACQVELQRRAGGDAMIGRTLCPLLQAAGFARVVVEPRMVYVDANRPDLADGFVRRTFAAMVEGVADRAVAAGLAEPAAFADGVRALRRCAEPDGMFGYTFFRATASAP